MEETTNNNVNLSNDLVIKMLNKELKVLKAELVNNLSSIKNCKNKEDRQSLFAEKKEIQEDIKEIEAEIKLLQEENSNTIEETANSEQKPAIEKPQEEIAPENK